MEVIEMRVEFELKMDMCNKDSVTYNIYQQGLCIGNLVLDYPYNDSEITFNNIILNFSRG